ncbi:hypothetical protein B0H34DRAFT_861033 [Crassisporium funariophilum]|nr:hypothetical protein B0H34DRAFT_861033 [Crassisporium funariophilum]
MPSKKQPCPCNNCNGRLRASKTVKKHQQQPSSSEPLRVPYHSLRISNNHSQSASKLNRNRLYNEVLDSNNQDSDEESSEEESNEEDRPHKRQRVIDLDLVSEEEEDEASEAARQSSVNGERSVSASQTGSGGFGDVGNEMDMYDSDKNQTNNNQATSSEESTDEDEHRSLNGDGELPDHSPNVSLGEESSDDEAHASNSRIESIRIAQAFVEQVKEATLDNGGLDKKTIHRLRNPQRGPVDISEPDTRLSIDLYISCNNASEKTYEDARKSILRRYPDSELLSYHSVKNLTASLSGVVSILDDMCINSCHAFTGPYVDLAACDTCSQPRFATSNRKPTSRKQACTIPLGPQIQALRRSSHGAAAMQYRDQKVSEILKNLGQITRYRSKHVLPALVVPGPNKPKNIDSFLFRSLHHLSALQRENNGLGLRVWDGLQECIIYSRIVFLLGTADAVGLTEIDGRVGHHGAQGCRIGCDMKGRHKPNNGHYFAAHLRPNNNPVSDCNHPDFDFKNIPFASSPDKYQANLLTVVNSRDQTDYERNRKQTGISKPSILSGLKASLMLPIPRCFTVDLMHLFCINIGELLIPIWRGTFKCDPSDNKDSWDWATLTGQVWVEHGKLVASSTKHFPSSFHRPPRNPAEKISSGYKATEYYLYLFGLGPAYFRTVLPQKYWKNFCKLVRGVRTVMQRNILGKQIQDAHLFLVQFVQEYENLYYQRRIDRLHFTRPSLHSSLHTALEIPRIGNGCNTSQYTMERAIGELGRGIRQPSNPFANLCQIALRKAQMNALQVMCHELDNTFPSQPRYSEDVGGGYTYLRPRDKLSHIFDEHQLRAIQNSEDCTMEKYQRWGRVQLPNGQVIRSVFSEVEKGRRSENGRVTRNVKLSINGATEFGEVQFFFLDYISTPSTPSSSNSSSQLEDNRKPTPLAMVLLYQHPDQTLLTKSFGTLWACERGGQDNYQVISISAISSLVSMQPLPRLPGDRENLWFVVEKCGLDDTDIEWQHNQDISSSLSARTGHYGTEVFHTNLGSSMHGHHGVGGNVNQNGHQGQGSISSSYIPARSNPQLFELLYAADHRTLLQSGNPLYFSLYEENTRLKAQLGTFDQAKLRISELEQMLLTAPVHQTRMQPPVAAPTYQPSTSGYRPLIMPPKPIALRKEDFPNTRFWTLAEWTDYRDSVKRRGLPAPGKLGFLRMANEGSVTPEYMRQMGDSAREIFIDLLAASEAPQKWKKKSTMATDYYFAKMYEKHPELSRCQGHWKAEAFAVVRYTDFKAQHLPEASDDEDVLPSAGKRKRHPPDPNDEQEQQRKKKVQQIQDPPRPSVQAKDKQKASSTMRTIPPAESEPETAAPKPIASSDPATETPHEPLRSPSTIPRSSSTLGSPIDLSVSSPMPPMERPQAVAEPSEENGLHADDAQPCRLRRKVNPLANFTVPDIDQGIRVPVITTSGGASKPSKSKSSTSASTSAAADPKTTTPSTSTSANITSGSRTAAPSTSVSKDKTSAASVAPKENAARLQKTTNSTTPRNLFAIDYLKDHSPSQAEFKVIWDNLDKKTVEASEQVQREIQGSEILDVNLHFFSLI